MRIKKEVYFEKEFVFSTVFIIVFCLISIQGQIKKESALQSKFKDLFLVDKRKPSVYISFERKGKLEPLFNGESSNRIWLRINNNTKGEISFCSFQVKKQYGDIGIVYDINEIFGSDVEIESNLNSDSLKIEKPNGYSTGDMCFPYYVSSGNSVLFSIPIESLILESPLNMNGKDGDQSLVPIHCIWPFFPME